MTYDSSLSRGILNKVLSKDQKVPQETCGKCPESYLKDTTHEAIMLVSTLPKVEPTEQVAISPKSS